MTKAAELAKMGEVLTNSQIGGRRNIVVNGAMQISQRSSSAVTGIGASDGYFTCDRWNFNTNGNSAGRLTMSQASDGPSGFANCLKLECTTPDTSIAAAERFFIEQKLEGQDVQQLKKGTSDAEKVTISFYVKGHDSATYTVGLYEGTSGRKIAATFPVTTSWVRQTVTFDGDTSGVIPDDNTAQLHLRFYLHAGSNYTSGTLGTSWNADGNTTQISSDGNSFFESTSATFFLTGVQLEVGSVATPFEHRSFGEELGLCQRYYERSGLGSPAKANSSTEFWIGHTFLVEKRTAATMSIINTSASLRVFEFGIGDRDSDSTPSLSAQYAQTKSSLFRIGNFSGISAGDTGMSAGLVSDVTADIFQFDAEL